LLPGIDDGAKTFEDSFKTYASASGFWVTEFITTPIQYVWENTHEGIASKKVETIQQLEKNNITIPFKPQQST
jgi:tyrosine-protein phosphatase YwqE